MPGAAASPVFDFGENSVTKESASGLVTSAVDILNSLVATQSPEQTTPEHETSAILAAVPAVPAVPAVITSNSFDQKPHLTHELATTVQSSVVSAIDEPPSLMQVNEITQEAVDELALMLWVGERNWFLSDNDSEFPDALKQQLLLNVASAIGEKVEEDKVVNFNWPFFGNRRLPGNDLASMLSLLFEWISQRLPSGELTGFIMGEKATRFLLQKPSTNISGISGQKIELSLSDELGVMVVPTLSLNDMLRTPSNKKQVWQHLKPFHIK